MEWGYDFRMGKLSYLKNSLLHRFSSNYCPSCGSENAKIIDSKFLGLTKLLQCDECFLRYRFPTDSIDFNYQFYQSNYVQSGLTTDLPSKEELHQLMRASFANTEKDFTIYSNILEFLSVHFNRKLRILDYGANWGYTCYLFKQMDF